MEVSSVSNAYRENIDNRDANEFHKIIVAHLIDEDSNELQ